jgi:hypothetical protein
MAKNPDEYLGIAEESTNFVMKNALPCHIDLWIVEMLREYASHLTFKITEPSLPYFNDAWQYEPESNTNH